VALGIFCFWRERKLGRKEERKKKDNAEVRNSQRIAEKIKDGSREKRAGGLGC
jgi:hypothetical protein